LSHFKELPASLEPHRNEIVRSGESYDYAEHLSPHADHSTAVSDDLVRALAIVGSAAECANRLRELRDAGVDTFIFPIAGRGRAARWRRIRDEIVGQIMV